MWQKPWSQINIDSSKGCKSAGGRRNWKKCFPRSNPTITLFTYLRLSIKVYESHSMSCQHLVPKLNSASSTTIPFYQLHLDKYMPITLIWTHTFLYSVSYCPASFFKTETNETQEWNLHISHESYSQMCRLEFFWSLRGNENNIQFEWSSHS